MKCSDFYCIYRAYGKIINRRNSVFAKMKSKKFSKQGFTIIEVVLVLAIAGLIFATVFIGLPALRQSQRDNQRRNDAAIIAAAVKAYMKNNHGNPPPDTGEEDTIQDREYIESIFGSDSEVTKIASRDSVALRRYLGTDINKGGVTNVVSVTNLYNSSKDVIRLAFVIDEEEISGVVTVVVGGKCPDLSKETNAYFDINITHKRSDVSIVRYLEKGYWYCLDA